MKYEKASLRYEISVCPSIHLSVRNVYWKTSFFWLLFEIHSLFLVKIPFNNKFPLYDILLYIVLSVSGYKRFIEFRDMQLFNKSFIFLMTTQNICSVTQFVHFVHFLLLFLLTLNVWTLILHMIWYSFATSLFLYVILVDTKAGNPPPNLNLQPDKSADLWIRICNPQFGLRIQFIKFLWVRLQFICLTSLSFLEWHSHLNLFRVRNVADINQKRHYIVLLH